jgi:homogentisate 1,2-dioxygenase
MLWKDSKDSKGRSYNEGYQSFVASEAEGYEGALPKRGNNPQKCAFGLYAEQLSGTAFTAPRAENLR